MAEAMGFSIKIHDHYLCETIVFVEFGTGSLFCCILLVFGVFAWEFGSLLQAIGGVAVTLGVVTAFGEFLAFNWRLRGLFWVRLALKLMCMVVFAALTYEELRSVTSSATQSRESIFCVILFPVVGCVSLLLSLILQYIARSKLGVFQHLYPQTRTPTQTTGNDQ